MDLPEARRPAGCAGGFNSSWTARCINGRIPISSSFRNGTPTDDLPDRLLSPSQIETFLYDLRRKADVIVIDSSPLIVSDAISLAARADGVLIVIRPGHTNKEMIKNMLDKVERAGANIVGVV